MKDSDEDEKLLIYFSFPSALSFTILSGEKYIYNLAVGP